MTTSDEILTIANKIANKGNKPTVALIKAHLSKKVPLPEIISVLKTWQHDPDFTALTEDNDGVSATELPYTQEKGHLNELALQQELSGIKEEIIALKTMVQTLINQQLK